VTPAVCQKQAEGRWLVKTKGLLGTQESVLQQAAATLKEEGVARPPGTQVLPEAIMAKLGTLEARIADVDAKLHRTAGCVTGATPQASEVRELKTTLDNVAKRVETLEKRGAGGEGADKSRAAKGGQDVVGTMRDAFGLVSRIVDALAQDPPQLPADAVELVKKVDSGAWAHAQSEAFKQIQGMIIDMADGRVATNVSLSKRSGALPKDVVGTYEDAFRRLPQLSRRLARSAAMKQIDEMVSTLRSEPKAVPADILKARKELDLEGLDDPDFVSAYETLRKMVGYFDSGPEQLKKLWDRQTPVKLERETKQRLDRAADEIIALGRQRPVDAAFMEVKLAIEAVAGGGKPGQLPDWQASLTPLDILIQDAVKDLRDKVEALADGKPTSESEWPDLSKTLTGDTGVAKEPYTTLRTRIVELSKTKRESEIADKAFKQIGEFLGLLKAGSKLERVEPLRERDGLAGPIWDAYDQLVGLAQELQLEPDKRTMSRESIVDKLTSPYRETYSNFLKGLLERLADSDEAGQKATVEKGRGGGATKWKSDDNQHFTYTKWWNRGKWKDEPRAFPFATRLSIAEPRSGQEEGTSLKEDPEGRFSWVRLPSPPGVFIYPDAGCDAADVSACFAVPEGFAGLDPKEQTLASPARCEVVSGVFWRVVEKGVIEQRS
jgi:hypothetical protein